MKLKKYQTGGVTQYQGTKYKNGDTYFVGNTGIHSGSQAVLLPEIQVTPQSSISNIKRELLQSPMAKLYAKDQPLSGTDPIGQFIVEGAALNPVFKLAGKAALYGAGRLGSNYARAKLLSGAMQEVGTLENKIPLNVGWGPKQNLNVYHASDSPIDKFKFPNKDNWAVKTNKHPSDVIYFAEGNSPSSGFLSKRPYVQNYNIQLNKPMVQVGEVQNISSKNIQRGNLLRFAQSNNADAYIMQDIADNQMKHQNIISNFSDKNINKVFKSEINWDKWNPEIPKNKQLLNEYNNIERATKESGTWMKNSDGSVFKGTPEQFIQQRSENFKKAFGDSKLINPDGSPTIQYHGSAKKFNTFDESKFQLGDTGYSGKGIYTTPSKTMANSYATSSARFHSGEINPTVYELYGQANNPISSSQLIKEGTGKDLFNFHRNKNWEGELTPEESLMQYDAAIADQLQNVKRIRPWNDARELVFPSNKQLKSAIGNNGMFDMTNPNIYKTIAAGLSLQGLNKLNNNQRKK